jgi:eukaryotic-like serine/threonine-protein kinase
VSPETERSRLESVFLAALERPTAARDEFLRAECASAPELIPIIHEMLEGERRTRDASPWGRPIWEAAALRFGPYRVTGRIGSGGMGVVYEAVRDDDEFHKRVAIKTISPALLTDYAARKLRDERQILAQLEHPNIARLLDGGTTPEGLPYVVMEYIEGEPLTAYVQARKLGVDARLELFLEVCRAVEFAHANLVVHADLKPANILATADGAPKLLDFGLARLLDRGDATVVRALTPGYASPEQVAGGPITTASDVYSLGVLLYELLAGRLPEGNASHSGADGDLDNIVEMARRVEPAERYRSVAALADDVRRFLNNYPVAARGRSALYRARKFFRRNRVALAAAALALTTAATGAVLDYRESRRTLRHFEEVRALAHSLLFDTYDAIAELPGAVGARRNVAALANQYLNLLAADPSADFALRKELAISYRRLAEIRGWPYLENLGDTAGALENLRQAETLLQECGRERPQDRSIALEFSKVENGLGVIAVRQGNPGEGVSWQTKALARVKGLLAAEPDNTTYRQAVAGTEIYLGQALYIRGSRQRELAPAREALRHYVAGAAVDAELLTGRPDDAEAEFQVGRAATFVAYAHWLLADLGDPGDHDAVALAKQQDAVAYFLRAAGRSPENVRYQRGLLDVRADISTSLWRLGERRDAIEMLLEGSRAAARRAAASPDNREAQFDYAQTCHKLAEWSLGLGERAQARLWASRTLGIYASLRAEDPNNEEVVSETIRLDDVFGDEAAARGHLRAAADWYRDGLRAAESLRSATAARTMTEQRAKVASVTR